MTSRTCKLTGFFANLDNENTRRAYRNGVGDFIRFAATQAA